MTHEVCRDMSDAIHVVDMERIHLMTNYSKYSFDRLVIIGYKKHIPSCGVMFVYNCLKKKHYTSSVSPSAIANTTKRIFLLLSYMIATSKLPLYFP